MLKRIIALLLLVFVSGTARAEWQMDEFMIFGGWPWTKGADPEILSYDYYEWWWGTEGVR